ncbi:MAG: response regulator transcription factor [Rubrivivax sp.]
MTVSSSKIRILVVDDHMLFRRGLTALLQRDPQFEVVGDAADASQAQRRAAELKPDIILLDNHLPGVNGVDALPALLEAAPGVRVLMLTISEDEQDLSAALRGGACGYLLKTIEGDALSAAIRRVMRGEKVVAEEMTGKLVAAYRDASAAQLQPSPSPVPALAASRLDVLSQRELDILRGIARGQGNKEIARSLGIAETTVKIHVQHILRKLEVSSRVHAAVIASEHGLC